MKHKTICRYNKFGFCKFSEKCQFRHNNSLCKDNHCKILECEKRHPKICKYKRDYGRCKFNPCSYSHESQTEVKSNSDKIESLEKKVAEMETKDPQQNISELEGNIVHKLEAFEKSMEEKMKAYEKQIVSLNNKMREKDDCITVLESRILVLETKDKQINENIESLTIKIGNCESITEKKKQTEFVCNFCDFATTSNSGLKVHMRRKHTEYSKDKFPKPCDLCGKVVSDAGEMKKHVKSHSYKFIQVQCSYCNFCATDEEEIVVHVGLDHGGNFECGLCDYVAEDRESLLIHLSTCEVYKCGTCKEYWKTLPALKTHFENLHAKEIYTSIEHIKQNRTNSEVLDINRYKFKDLFG